MNVGSLFSGIGGFDLGFERAGMHPSWQVELDPFCRRVLARHFPDAERFEDVREVGAHNLASVDVISGGVPCQPVSGAGKGLGEADERWLWPDTLRVIGELRPRYAVLENPAIFIGRGLVGVLGELATLGYDAEWSVVSAADVGAPHLRKRVWIVAYPDGERTHGAGAFDQGWEESANGGCRAGTDLADSGGLGRRQGPGEFGGLGVEERSWWSVEPDVGRVAHGVPNRVDRLRSLGNALVPQIAEWIGRRLMEAER